LTVRAVDFQGRSATDSVAIITVDEVLAVVGAPGLIGDDARLTARKDDTPPTLAIVSPTERESVSGTVLWTVSAADDTGVDRVIFFIDAAAVHTDLTPPYAHSWDTANADHGPHTLRARAYDSAGNAAEAVVNVFVPSADKPTAFPNPYRFDGPLTITSLVPGSTARIFSLTGRRLTELTVDAMGRATWWGTASDGRAVASGLYLVFAQGMGGSETLKIVVIRH
jgi:hypothetical protein